MRRYEVLQALKDLGVIAVIRGSSSDSIYPTISAIKVGGIKAIEITTTVPSADLVIAELVKKDKELLVGAGTVLDPITARLCIMRGASFIVSPSFSEEVAKVCNLYGILYIPAVATSSEIVTAMQSGASLLKLFPSSSLSPSIIKDLNGPFPQASFMPTGGVSLNNVGEWIRNGAFVVGVGSLLTKASKKGDYTEVKNTARAFLDEISKARKDKILI